MRMKKTSRSSLTSCTRPTRIILTTRSAARRNRSTSRRSSFSSRKLRKMKSDWWEMKAEELQAAADNHNMKTFHDGLCTVCGSKASGSTPVRSSDQSILLTEKTDILAGWTLQQCPGQRVNHFWRGDCIPATTTCACEGIAGRTPPTSAELAKASKQTSPGKAPRADGIPTNIYKWRWHAQGPANVPIQVHLESGASSTRPQGYHSFASLGRFLPGSYSTDSPHTSLIPSSLNRSADLEQVGAPATWFLLSLSYRRNAVSRIRSSTWCS